MVGNGPLAHSPEQLNYGRRALARWRRPSDAGGDQQLQLVVESERMPGRGPEILQGAEPVKLTISAVASDR